jgi:hypothetical protein
MSQCDSFDEREDDADLESLLSPLQRIEPPAAAREEFRAAVAAELDGGVAPQRGPWWRRTIAVPVPVALGAAVMLLASAAWSVSHRPTVDHPALDSQPVVRPAGPEIALLARAEPAATSPVPPSPELEYHVTETYLCGVGRVRSVSSYSIRE